MYKHFFAILPLIAVIAGSKETFALDCALHCAVPRYYDGVNSGPCGRYLPLPAECQSQLQRPPKPAAVPTIPKPESQPKPAIEKLPAPPPPPPTNAFRKNPPPSEAKPDDCNGAAAGGAFFGKPGSPDRPGLGCSSGASATPPPSTNQGTSGPIQLSAKPEMTRWYSVFPNDTQSAAIVVSLQALEILRRAKQASVRSLREMIKEKGKNEVESAVLDRLPFSEKLREELDREVDLMKREYGLFKDVKLDTQRFLTRYFAVTSDSLTCLGSSVQKDCAAVYSFNEVNANDYADQSGKRWKSWLLDDLKTHVKFECPQFLRAYCENHRDEAPRFSGYSGPYPDSRWRTDLRRP